MKPSGRVGYPADSGDGSAPRRKDAGNSDSSDTADSFFAPDTGCRRKRRTCGGSRDTAGLRARGGAGAPRDFSAAARRGSPAARSGRGEGGAGDGLPRAALVPRELPGTVAPNEAHWSVGAAPRYAHGARAAAAVNPLEGRRVRAAESDDEGGSQPAADQFATAATGRRRVRAAESSDEGGSQPAADQSAAATPIWRATAAESDGEDMPSRQGPPHAAPDAGAGRVACRGGVWFGARAAAASGAPGRACRRRLLMPGPPGAPSML